jgi:hypothetical protein
MGIRWFGAVAWMAVASCGSSPKQPDKPVPQPVVQPSPPPETEADREAKRHAAAVAIVPDGSSCLPTTLRDNGAPHLDLASLNNEAVLCAVDGDKSRLLGTVGCWKVNLDSGSLTYQSPTPLLGHDVDVKLHEGCARDFCLAKDTKLPDDGMAHLSWNLDGTKVAILAGDDVHVFDASTKQLASQFSIRVDKGPTGPANAVSFIGDYVVVEAGTAPATGAWVFKVDGTAVGPISEIGAKDATPISTTKGSLLLLDATKVAVAEQGFSTVTVYELATGKRTKLVRKVNKPSCKPDELDEYWRDGDKVSDACHDSMRKSYEHLIGASAVAGTHSWLVVLRGPRLGELAVLDPRTLAEKKSIKLPWCEASAGSAAAAAPSAP